MKKFFMIKSKAEFFAIVRTIRAKGKRFTNEAMACGVEVRGYTYHGMFITIWYGDDSFRISLNPDNGFRYYYYPESGVVEVEKNHELFDIIR